MNIESILKKIMHNWFPKTLCIIAAIILFVFGLTSQLEKRSFNVPLQAVEDGALQRSSGIPSNVLVTIRTKPQTITTITSADIQAVIDFSYYTREGTYAVPINLSLSKDIILNDPVELTVSPNTYTVKLESKVRKSVPIVVPIVGNPLHGYELKENRVNPQVAIIEGPKSMVENVKEINTQELYISEKKDDFSEKLSLLNLNKFITIVSPKQVESTAFFQTSLVEKTYSNCPVFFANLDSKFEITSSENVSFTISGAELVVERFFPSEYTIQVDCSHITKAGEYELPISIAVQDAFKIETQSHQVVKVVVSDKKENQESQTLDKTEKTIEKKIEENIKE